MELKEHLQAVQKLPRKQHHPLLHGAHQKFQISRKTLFYIKEYGPHTHIAHTIIRESVRVLIFASVLSSLGGLAIEQIKTILVSLTPLVIMLPAMNALLGDFGIVISSKFSTMLHEGKITNQPLSNFQVKKLITQMYVITLITVIFALALAYLIANFQNHPITYNELAKISLIIIIDMSVLIGILSIISITAGYYFFRKGEDPNNFLIPITTSIADFGNMIILALLVTLLF